MDGAIWLKVLAVVPPAVFAITVHEVAHGWVARACGDPTAADARRLTLNPVRHIDPLGTLVVPAVLFLLNTPIFGWAKPVPVDWRRLNRPRRDIALVALAGPAANLAMLFGWVLVGRLFSGLAPDAAMTPFVLQMCRVGFIVNTILMLLNLLPVPPLDGSRVVTVLLPRQAAIRYNEVGRFGLLIVLVLLMSGILAALLGPPLFWIIGQASRLAGM